MNKSPLNPVSKEEQEQLVYSFDVTLSLIEDLWRKKYFFTAKVKLAGVGTQLSFQRFNGIWRICLQRPDQTLIIQEGRVREKMVALEALGELEKALQAANDKMSAVKGAENSQKGLDK